MPRILPRTASSISDAEIEEVILADLALPHGGEHTNRSLRETVALVLRCPNLQTRRVGRIAWDLAQRGLIRVREIPGDYGFTLVRFSR